MTVRVCPEPGCPNLLPCSVHAPAKRGSWSPTRNRGAQARFRRQVLARDEYTCQRCYWRDETGGTLVACHIRPFAEGGGYELENGITRCKPCDRATDPYAR